MLPFLEGLVRHAQIFFQIVEFLQQKYLNWLDVQVWLSFTCFLFKAEDKQEGIVRTIGFKFLPKQSSMWCVFL